MNIREALKGHGVEPEELEIPDKISSKEVFAKCDGTLLGFPSNTHRNVHVWWLLNDGSAVGLNESPRTGFGYARASAAKIAKAYPDLSATLKEVDSLDALHNAFDANWCEMALQLSERVSVIFHGFVTTDKESPRCLLTRQQMLDLELEDLPEPETIFSEKGRVTVYCSGFDRGDYEIESQALQFPK